MMAVTWTNWRVSDVFIGVSMWTAAYAVQARSTSWPSAGMLASPLGYSAAGGLAEAEVRPGAERDPTLCLAGFSRSAQPPLQQRFGQVGCDPLHRGGAVLKLDGSSLNV